MKLAAERFRRSLVSLLALAFLIGSSLAAVHLHFWDGGAPAVSSDQHNGDPADAVCSLCLGLQTAGHYLPPNPPVLAVSAAWLRLPTAATVAVPDRDLPLAFRSRAPPLG